MSTAIPFGEQGGLLVIVRRQCGEVPGCLMYRGRSYGRVLLAVCMDRKQGFFGCEDANINFVGVVALKKEGREMGFGS